MKMKQAFFKFNKGVMKMPMPVPILLFVLVTANFIAPLFFLNHPEAWFVLGSFMAGIALMIFLTARTGFTRLLGLGHIFWVPLLVFLWMRLDQIPPTDPFGIWVRVVMVLNAVSLVADTGDVVRYISGDRKETVEGIHV